jgi:transposase
LDSGASFCASFTTINLNQRVPADHPLRGIKARVDKVLVQLSPLFDELYADEGRPSIPPEQLLKSRILMALYSVRSERLFCEQLAYNLLWLWFLDRELDEGSFDPSGWTASAPRTSLAPCSAPDAATGATGTVNLTVP